MKLEPLESNNGSKMNMRPLRETDLDLICRHRAEMFRESGRSDDVLQTMTEHFRRWLAPRLCDGSYFGFLMTENDDQVAIAGIGLMTIDWPPHPLHPTTDKRGYVLNVFVEPAYRKRGIARELMKLAESEFAKRGIEYAVLHATEQGRALYSQLGWSGTTEMAKIVTA
jgi:ribosomal protein S18 acetylase RimI-like enzyme